MKSLRILVPLVVAFSYSAFAADPTVPNHWYRITIAAGSETESFVGSAPFDAEQMSARISDVSLIALENRREEFANENQKLEYGWHPSKRGSKVFIVPRSVLYFEELSGDPAGKPQ